MKILLVNWSWYPSGGDWTYVENIHKLYEEKGYDVIPFSTHNKKNIFSPYSGYFVNTYDFKELNKRKNLSNGIKALKTSVISKDALAKLDLLLDVHDIKIAHLNNIHHYITPAIIVKLKNKGIKIIWTLHDFKIICPENSFISNGVLCEKCINGSFYHCAINLCKKKSFLASSLASFEAYYYHSKNTYDLVDYFLCPSIFLSKKFIEFGFNPSRLLVSNSCYDIDLIDLYISNYKLKNAAVQPEKYVLYIGRLEEIKGVQTLIEAVKDTNIKVKIVGSGVESHNFKTMAAGFDNIEFLGFKNKQEVFKLTQECLYVVCPSICYENLPFSIIESFLFYKPVIGSDIGGIPELVMEGKTGLLFEAGNVAHLCEKMNYLWNNNEIVEDMGNQARVFAHKMVNFKSHWSKIETLLLNLI